MMTPNGLLYSVNIVEMVPGKWWVVQITNKDGDYTLLDGPRYNKEDIEMSEMWLQRGAWPHRRIPQSGRATTIAAGEPFPVANVGPSTD